MKAGVLFANLLIVAGAARGTETLVLPLSGMGADGEKPVYWDFQLDTGRGSGSGKNTWTRIVVPSNWEQQGFGSYYYGTQGRGKPDDDPVIPKETGTYRRGFEVPAAWNGREIHIVFEAAMTDTSVLINGQSAGPVHQGGFYRFSYDITKLVKPGRNEIEVRVAKESANASVNRAERRGDYWTFGGIYRPLWLEARPATHIDWTAIDARADGSFFARAVLNRPPPAGSLLVVRLLDGAGQPLEPLITSAPVGGTDVRVTGKLPSPAAWTAETPHLYTARFSLVSAGRPLHTLDQRFGFRTFEVRPNDGVYLNGRKIVLKGINRHSFDARSGRTLTRAQNYADARLIKGANMNAVRMSHYPPDREFLDAADEIGLYVLDELAGWQGFYDQPTGARLIGQIVRRDVNHPSILFWDNGNEGGWNRENDGEFHRWDPQRRPVLHPWAIHSAINTDHYENYDSTVRLSAGPEIFMPTEFLHGLYDGGIGAGFEDYWHVMGKSPTVAGGFFWAFADEGIERTDENRRIDNVGNAAPDGIVGARHEKEGSYFAVKEIWSPVQIRDAALASGRLSMTLENAYDFIDLSTIALRWRRLHLPAPGERIAAKTIAQGRISLPSVSPRTSREWTTLLPFEKLGPGEVLELTPIDPSGRDLWTWVLRGHSDAPRAEPAHNTPVKFADEEDAATSGTNVSAGPYRLRFDTSSGRLTDIGKGTRTLALYGPSFIAWQREPGKRTFRSATQRPTLQAFERAPANEPGVIARIRYADALREVTWKLRGAALVMEYEIDFRGEADILGVHFQIAEDAIRGKRWVGSGPYRIWKNRMTGTVFGLHEVAYARSIPGVSYHYPEFEGFFGPWDWLELRMDDGNLLFRNEGAIPYFGLLRPEPGEKPVIELPELGISFLHAIAPIGTKFALPDVLGPQSQPAVFDGAVHGEVTFAFPP